MKFLLKYLIKIRGDTINFISYTLLNISYFICFIISINTLVSEENIPLKLILLILYFTILFI